jgi:hypothetical protein
MKTMNTEKTYREMTAPEKTLFLQNLAEKEMLMEWFTVKSTDELTEEEYKFLQEKADEYIGFGYIFEDFPEYA